MFYNNVTINGVLLKVAFVRTLEGGLAVTGISEIGQTVEFAFSFADNLQMIVKFADDTADVAPVAHAKKLRKSKVAAEAAPVSNVVNDVISDEEFLTLTGKRGRGRPSKEVSAKIAAYKAAHG